MNIIQNVPSLLRRHLPILTWGAGYSRRTLASDLIVAAIVTIMLIPQSLAYALLAGLPPQFVRPGRSRAIRQDWCDQRQDQEPGSRR